MTAQEENIEKYLLGQLDAKALEVFEQQLTNDVQLQADVTTYMEMRDLLNDADWSLIEKLPNSEKVKAYSKFLKSAEGKKVKASIANAAQSYFDQKETKKSHNYSWAYAIAATLTLLIAAWFIFGMNNSNDPANLYAENSNWKELPSLTVRGNENELAKAEQLFGDKKFREALTIFNNFQNKNNSTYNGQVAIYQGICHLELNNTEQAITIFTNLGQSNDLDASKANWYLALSFLNKGALDQCKSTLRKIIQNERNFNFNKATTLLEKLK